MLNCCEKWEDYKQVVGTFSVSECSGMRERESERESLEMAFFERGHARLCAVLQERTPASTSEPRQTAFQVNGHLNAVRLYGGEVSLLAVSPDMEVEVKSKNLF